MARCLANTYTGAKESPEMEFICYSTYAFGFHWHYNRLRVLFRQQGWTILVLANAHQGPTPQIHEFSSKVAIQMVNH